MALIRPYLGKGDVAALVAVTGGEGAVCWREGDLICFSLGRHGWLLNGILVYWN